MADSQNSPDDKAELLKSNGPLNLKSPKEAISPDKPPRAPLRTKKRRSSVVFVLNFFFSFAFLGVLGSLALFYWGQAAFHADGPLEKQRIVMIEQGSGLTEIAKELERANVISSPLLFQAAARLSKQHGSLKHGDYLFEQGASMQSVMEKLVEGEAVVYKVTLPEGMTSFQIVNLLYQNDVLVGDIEEVPTEGSLLPNTYSFGRGTTRQQMIDRMKAAQSRAVAKIWKGRIAGLPLKSSEELVVLASIVEKETGQADERSKVARVFINRLNRGMRLQSDPTIIYGLFGGKGQPEGRPIYKSDISKPTAYNTYVIDALPPGPIANPGLAAMEAVARPSVTKDLYFVANGTGGHAFAQTLEEHNNNVRRWRRIEAENDAEKQNEKTQ